ncbi:phosphotransferase [Streptomyces sp. NBC_01803]|uniref:phosphotransferase n=1 Tax=Streptomyces sp. NBC_01803 TaxID=2975946 RepID=UPI002DD96044|nr:phosphotransferase [Streptomyces sp. NBC_01803]WSA47332.1 phosphotransferase [Streptomyces sp. NBC_01803]
MAHYTKLDVSTIQRLCAAFGLVVHHAESLDGGMANSSYLTRGPQGLHVLTVLDNHDPDSARNLGNLLRHLNGEGVSTPAPLITSDGAIIAVHERRPVMVRPYVAGRCHKVLPGRLLPAVGAALAVVHGMPVDGVPAVPFQGRRLPVEARLHWGTFRDRGFAAWLSATWPEVDPTRWGGTKAVLVHGDLFADNIVVAGEELVILDWETASVDDPLIDLGMCVVGLCHVEGRFRPDRARLLFRGYRAAAGRPKYGSGDLYRAAVYAAVVIAHHRYVRHHVTHPDPAYQHLYREMPPFVEQMRAEWMPSLSV